MKFKHILIIFLISTFLGGCNGNSRITSQINETDKKGAETGTSIQWADSVLNLGKVKMGDTVVFRYRFTNTGKYPLIIQNSETSCSCTRIITSVTAVPPGSSGEIVAVYDTRKSIVGFVYKALRVTTNTLPAKMLLRYSAEVTGHKLIRGNH